MISEKQEKLNYLYKNGYRFIVKIDIHREAIGDKFSKFDVEISLSNGDMRIAKIYAWDCLDISIGKIDNMLSAFVESIDVRNDQIEGIRYKILDSENHLFKLLCLDFKVEV